ncbi:hypothetical protein I8J29_02640 [Paenibacillus sp. MWE-103]|uniref:Immunity protein 50 of polymorphic toxin system n=1 Tax=Paenibacillus artemisiicola TaxID=1172618 RepID=A0ABS3W440_9BACL|nr:hypothetical protein [Paenibacillus artemisiicola]MBO7743079.1 hypothetical protein [Paenibacillus artemisiicola]
MPAILLDYKVSQPSNGMPGGVLPGDIPLPLLTSDPDVEILLADIGLFLSSGAPNRVELSMTLGLAHPSNDVLAIRIAFIRDGDVIWVGTHDLEGVGDFETEELHLITTEGADFDVSEGFHVYECRLSYAGTGVIEITGPITFSGAAYAMT